jgi:hypothetical protein
VAVNFHAKTSRIKASALPNCGSPPGSSGGSLDAAPHWGAAIPIPTIADRRGNDCLEIRPPTQTEKAARKNGTAKKRIYVTFSITGRT